MSSLRGDPKIIDYIPVNSRWMDKESGAAIEDDEIPKIAQFVKEKSIPPEEELSLLIDMGRDYVNAIRNSLGLSEVDYGDYMFSILSTKDFDEVIQRLTNGTSDGEGRLAVHVSALPEVLIKDLPEHRYKTASALVHEWVHYFIDRKVHVVSSNSKSINEGDTEGRRSGLSVSRIPTFEDRGELLNEMGNFLVQMEFANKVLEETEILQKEKLFREEQLSRMNFRKDDGNLYDWHATLANGELFNGVIEKKNIHFDINGDWDTQMYFFISQLADDLAYLVDRKKTGVFRNALLTGKVYPETQGEIKRLVDGVMGRGFYFKLKRAEYTQEGLMPILREVQEKRYLFLVNTERSAI